MTLLNTFGWVTRDRSGWNLGRKKKDEYGKIG